MYLSILTLLSLLLTFFTRKSSQICQILLHLHFYLLICEIFDFLKLWVSARSWVVVGTDEQMIESWVEMMKMMILRLKVTIKICSYSQYNHDHLHPGPVTLNSISKQWKMSFFFAVVLIKTLVELIKLWNVYWERDQESGGEERCVSWSCDCLRCSSSDWVSAAWPHTVLFVLQVSLIEFTSSDQSRQTHSSLSYSLNSWRWWKKGKEDISHTWNKISDIVVAWPKWKPFSMIVMWRQWASQCPESVDTWWFI